MHNSELDWAAEPIPWTSEVDEDWPIPSPEPVPRPPGKGRGRGRGRGTGRVLTRDRTTSSGPSKTFRTTTTTPTASRGRRMASTNTGSSFNQTLHFITEIKLKELEKQRLAYKEHAKVLEEVKSISDVVKKVEVLTKAIKSWTGSGSIHDTKTIEGKLHLIDLEFWLQQAKKDPSFSKEIAEGWAEALEQHIKHIGMRFDTARLFGMLFNEWLASGDSSAVAYQGPSEDTQGDNDTATDASSFVEVGRKEMYEQKEKLLSIVFEDHPVDTDKLKTYLEELFESEEATKALEKLRKELKEFSYHFKRKKITVKDVQNTLAGVLASGLMGEEKRTTLKAFEENMTVLQEVASVLNMRMANIQSWSWPEKGIMVEFRRHLNGKYRAFTDPEIVDALLLHYIGVAWQVKLKSSLRRIFDSKAWNRPQPPPGEKRNRWNAQLRGDDGSDSIDMQRNASRRLHFFMSQLHDEASKASAYDDLVDAPEPSDDDPSSPAQIKRQLMHIITTESYLNQAVHGSHTTVRSDLEWFGPSLPHKSILTVLEFMGMSKTWLNFYSAFLAAPIRFPGDTSTRVRLRGTPISYALSVVCGEVVLFMMDYGVNQRAKGLHLYRMHDDLWLWDKDPAKVADGWEEMNTYAKLVGLKFNEYKTGSAYVGPESVEVKRLPEGDIRWGFLRFESDKGRFVIDQNDVDGHIQEMRRQLDSTKSVFGWVNAYNKYMTFFLRNFGGLPANCVGKDHVIDMIDTLGRIQRRLFAESEEGGAVGYLRRTIKERFDTTDLPEGYFYIPIATGGLELRNTMLELLCLMRREKPLALPTEDDNLAKKKKAKNDAASISSSLDDDDVEPEQDYGADDGEFFDEEKAVGELKFPKRVENDRLVYKNLEEVWELDKDNRRSKKGPRAAEAPFMSFEEYTSLRESWLGRWGQSYRNMLETPDQMEVDLVPKVRELTEHGSIKWDELDWYQKWIVSMYGEEVVKKFGRLETVDPDLIPIGMLQLFKSSRMKLDQ